MVSQWLVGWSVPRCDVWQHFHLVHYLNYLKLSLSNHLFIWYLQNFSAFTFIQMYSMKPKKGFTTKKHIYSPLEVFWPSLLSLVDWLRLVTISRSPQFTGSVTLLTERMPSTGWSGSPSWAAPWPTSPSSSRRPTWTGTRTPAPAPSTGSLSRSWTSLPSPSVPTGPPTSSQYRPSTTCKSSVFWRHWKVKNEKK